MAGNIDDTRCEVCMKQLTVMKRCTRCKSVFYCSRECQVKHWSDHKATCLSQGTSSESKSPAISSKVPSMYKRDDHSIFGDEKNNGSEASSIKCVSHPPLVDFSKAVQKPTEEEAIFQQPDGKFYLNHGEFHTDVPEIDDQLPKSHITVKCHKERHKLNIQNLWTGVEVFKFLSYSLKIPLNKLKLIHKGKVLTEDNVVECIQDKAVFQVIGEQAESEEGVDQRDIAVMMTQMGLERNAAVKVLRNKGDLIDALLDQ